MNGKPPLSTYPGPSPAAQHRKQMRIQVWLPLGIMLLLVLTGMVFAVIGTVRGSEQVNHLGNLSAVWVIIPVLFTCLIGLVIVGAGVFGMSRLLKHMPGWMLRLQLLMLRVSLTMRRAADASTQPVMKANTASTRVRTLWQRIFGKR